MTRKSVLSIVGVVAVLGLVGVGYAAYTASATVNVNASAGSFYLQETGAVSASSLTSESAGCTYSSGGTVLTLTATNLLPGDFCNFTVTVTDPGTIGGNFYGPAVACSGPCTQLTWNQGNIGTYVPLAPLSGNADHFFEVVIDTGSGTVAESDSWTVTLTGTPA